MPWGNRLPRPEVTVRVDLDRPNPDRLDDELQAREGFALNLMEPSVSRQLAEYVAGTRFRQLPRRVVDMARRCFLDWLGSALAGYREPPAQMVLALVRGSGGWDQATVVGSLEKTSALNAALANGTMSHIIEMDDVHRASTFHPAAPIIPAALAAAELVGAAGTQLVTAIVVGYDVGIRVGETVNPSHYRFWHPTGTCGTFGAAAAAGHLLGLGIKQLVDSFGTAGTQAAGLWEFLADGTMSKHLHPGKAAMNGLLASLLAREGFTGAGSILEGERGFCAATSEGFDPADLVRDLGHQFKITDTSFKPYASCRHTHAGIDAALKIRERLLGREIESIQLATYTVARDLVGNPSPRTPYEAKFSLPFSVALALVKGSAAPGDFTPDMLAAGEIRSLLARTSVSVDPVFDRAYPDQWPARITVTLQGGTEVTETVTHPLGDPESPMSEEDLVAKFIALASPVTGEDVARTLAGRAVRLEELKARDLFEGLPPAAR